MPNFSPIAILDMLGDTNAVGDDVNNVRNNFGGAGNGDTLPFDGDVGLNRSSVIVSLSISVQE